MSVKLIKPGKYLIQLIHRQDGQTYRKRLVFNGPERKANEAYYRLKAEIEDKFSSAKKSSLKKTFRTFGECLEHYCQSMNTAKGKIHGLSWEKFRKERLQKDLGEIEIDDLTMAFERILPIWRREPTRKGTLPSTSSTNRLIQLSKAAVAYAYRFNYIQIDPLRMFSIETDLNARDVVITQEEFDRVYAQLPDWMKPITLMAWNVPSRKGELESVRREQIDLEMRVILLKSHTTKTKKGRVLPIPDSLLEYFKSIPADCPYAFYRLDKGTYRKLGDFHKTWKTACKRAKIEDVRFHDLRRCAATRLINGGVPESVVAKLGGWSNGFVMKKHYHYAGVNDLHKAIGNEPVLKMVPLVPLRCHSEAENEGLQLKKAG